MEVSFALPTAAEQPQPVVETVVVPTPVNGVNIATQVGAGPTKTTTAVATRPKMGMSSPVPMGDFLPDFGDIIVPRLNIVQKVGELSNIFTHGALLFNQNVILYEPPVLDKDGKIVKPGGSPLEIIVLGFKPKRFVEKIEGGGRSQILGSEAEVVAAGGTLSYQEWELKAGEGMRLFQPYSEAMLAIGQPDGLGEAGALNFINEVDGKKYALALWGMKGSSYTKAAKVFFTARSMGILRTGYSAYAFNLATRLEKFSTGNFAFVPVVTPKAPTTDAMKAFVKDVLSGPGPEATE